MKANFVSNITSTINLYLRVVFKLLVRIVLSPFDPKTNIPQQNNTKDNIAKQQLTQFLPQIPSLQPPFPPLSASQALRDNTSSFPSLSVWPSSQSIFLSAPWRLCGISFQSAVTNLKQSTGPPISAHHSFFRDFSG